MTPAFVHEQQEHEGPRGSYDDDTIPTIVDKKQRRRRRQQQQQQMIKNTGLASAATQKESASVSRLCRALPGRWSIVHCLARCLGNETSSSRQRTTTCHHGTSGCLIWRLFGQSTRLSPGDNCSQGPTCHDVDIKNNNNNPKVQATPQ